MNPKLREIEAHLVEHGGQVAILLRDPLRLSDKAVLLPRRLAPLLELCDGSRDEAELRAALAVRAGISLTPRTLEQILAQLDKALLLDNERFARAREDALKAYRAAPHRSPILAGEGYPADPQELTRLLEGYMGAAWGVRPTEMRPDPSVRGLISPHIDFQRGGLIYAQAWPRAAEAIRAAEIAIILGTDHADGGGELTLTRQHYATPWGVLPTAQAVVEAVSQAIGPEAAFRDELHHRSEHSIELAAVWLHYYLRDGECEMVPILCGSFEPFVAGESGPDQAPRLSAAIEALREATDHRRTLVIAAADLAHVGPAFGDPAPLDLVGRARLQAADERLIAAICAGDAEGLFQEVKREGDRWRICGLPPIYLALRLLGDTKGELVGYAQCPADPRGTSLVSICGVLLR
ncbi:MAG TPA: AmmeMemoRadiSam system protein B [Anaerolineae bacterium]|nr:AmmeMemoRadiSam system protein B [Anaerolineae bacterium]